jgi:hypothetical protein
MVGWSDLHSAVCQRLTAASAQGRGQWEKVLDLIEDRIESGVPKEAPPLGGQEWRLIGIEIEGFRGIGGTLRVHPDPAPGLTVVHAPNGSGKSSPRRRFCGRSADKGQRDRSRRHGVLTTAPLAQRSAVSRSN